jgi:hypothetical protein
MMQSHLDSRKQKDVEKKEMLVRLNFMNSTNNYLDEYRGGDRAG